MDVTQASCEMRESKILRVYKIRDSDFTCLQDRCAWMKQRLSEKHVTLIFYVSIRSLYVTVIFRWM